MIAKLAICFFHVPDSVTSVSSHARSLLEKTGVVPVQRNWSTVRKSGVQGLTGRKLSLTLKKRDAAALVSAVMAVEPVVTANSSG